MKFKKMTEVSDSVYYLNLFLLTPVIIFGLIGNCLSILTWSRGCHRDTSTAVLLTALAIVDTIVLVMPALELWFTKIFVLWIRRENIVTCKILAFASYFAPTVSSWIIVLITAERFVSIWFPVKVRKVCTRFKVKLLILAMVIMVAILYSPFLIFVRISDNVYHTNVTSGNGSNVTYFTICDMPETDVFQEVYLPVSMWLDLCFLFVIPFILIVSANALILYKILKSRTILIRQGRYISCRTRVANSFTIRAIAVSTVFLVCLLPVTANEVYYTHSQHRIEVIAYDIIHILLYGNSALNFILYCAIGSGFRKDLRKVLGNLCRRNKMRLDHMDSSGHPTRSAILNKRRLSEFIGL